MENTPVVNQAPVTGEPTQGQQPVGTEDTTGTAVTQPGEKTPQHLLLESLQEERDRRRKAEEELINLKSSIPSDDDVLTEGEKALKKQLNDLNERYSRLEEGQALEKVYSQFPDVQAMSSEFLEFRKDYPRHNIENVAKLFRVEKGLTEAPRKGLEKATGGTRTPLTSGMTAQDVENLRKTDYRQYQKMLMTGQLKIE